MYAADASRMCERESQMPKRTMWGRAKRISGRRSTAIAPEAGDDLLRPFLTVSPTRSLGLFPLGGHSLVYARQLHRAVPCASGLIRAASHHILRGSAQDTIPHHACMLISHHAQYGCHASQEQAGRKGYLIIVLADFPNNARCLSRRTPSHR